MHIHTGCPKKNSHVGSRVILGPWIAENQKKVRKQTPTKIQFYVLEGVFNPVYDMYTLLYIMYTKLVSGIC